VSRELEIASLYLLRAARCREWNEAGRLLRDQPGLATYVDQTGSNFAHLVAGIPGADEFIRSLAALGTSLNTKNLDRQTPLESAIDSGRPSQESLKPNVEALLSCGADPNLCTSYWCRPLQLALHRNLDEHIEPLLEHGADPCLSDEEYDSEDSIETARKLGNRASELLLAAVGRQGKTGQ